MTTIARVLDVNCRRSDVPTRYSWSKRKAGLIALINRQKPSIVIVQECTETQETDLLAGFSKFTKHRWESWDHGNSGVMWDTAKWTVVEKSKHNLKSAKGEYTRRLSLVKLRSVKTGEACWFGGTHLSVHFPTAATWRARQAVQIATLVNSDRCVIGGDLNSDAFYNKAGPRQEFYRNRKMAGLRGRTRRITEMNLNTHHGFKPPKRQGKWLDDIETGAAIEVLSGAVVPTGNNTDHCALFARIRFGEGVRGAEIKTPL